MLILSKRRSGTKFSLHFVQKALFSEFSKGRKISCRLSHAMWHNQINAHDSASSVLMPAASDSQLYQRPAGFLTREGCSPNYFVWLPADLVSNLSRCAISQRSDLTYPELPFPVLRSKRKSSWGSWEGSLKLEM